MAQDLAWLRLWRRLVAAALIQPLAWEPPYARGAALKRPKKKKKKRLHGFLILKYRGNKMSGLHNLSFLVILDFLFLSIESFWFIKSLCIEKRTC